MQRFRVFTMNTLVADCFPPPSKVDSGVERVAKGVDKKLADSGGKIENYASP